MKVLIACEESQIVCIEFRKKGHEAYSCDILPCSGGHPEWHIQEDVLEVMKWIDVVGLPFQRLRKQSHWDMMIGFPPCTYLANCGLHYLKTKPERKDQHKKAVEFFLFLYNSNISKIAIENPIGWMNTNWRKPDQIIQPYYFGDAELKTTCLWLKNLKPLKYQLENDLFANRTTVDRPKPYKTILRKTGSKAGQKYNYYFRQNKTAKERSKTFPGIAKAMADQWG